MKKTKDITAFEFLNKENIEYYKKKDIKPFLTIGIGGIVKAVIIIKDKIKLIKLLNILISGNNRFVVIGGGSNTVFSEDSSELFVIINKTSGISIEKDMINIQSGLDNKKILDICKSEGLCGLEFLAGIPGTIGGAAVVNAGAYGRSMSDVLEEAEVYFFSEGVKKIGIEGFKYRYRNSGFKYGEDVILSVKLKVEKCPVENIKSGIYKILKERNKKHPSYGKKTAGCFFKNPIINGVKISAGRLMEDAGLKGKTFGRITISDVHSNFVLNDNNASFKDILNAEEKLINIVKEKTGIKLEREVIYVLPDGKKI